MTTSTVTLRIQELAEAQGLTFKELSEASGIPVEVIQKYSDGTVSITEETAPQLRKLAAQLNVPIVDLVKPLFPKKMFKLKILENLNKEEGKTLEDLINFSQIPLPLLAFYITQPISEQKLNELQAKTTHFDKVCQFFNCTIEDLKVEADLPVTKLDIQGILEEKNLSLQNLSVLTELPIEFLDLLYTENIDTNQYDNNSNLLIFMSTSTSTNNISFDLIKEFCKMIQGVTGKWVCVNVNP